MMDFTTTYVRKRLEPEIESTLRRVEAKVALEQLQQLVNLDDINKYIDPEVLRFIRANLQLIGVGKQ